MSKGIKIIGWIVFVMCLSGGVTFGVLAYQQHAIMVENLEAEQYYGEILNGTVGPGHPDYFPIIEGHEAYTQAFILFTNYTLIGGSILVGTVMLQFVLNLINRKRRN